MNIADFLIGSDAAGMTPANVGVWAMGSEWIAKQAGHPAALDLDFVNGRYHLGKPTNELGTLLDRSGTGYFSRGGAAYAVNAKGVLASVAANRLRRPYLSGVALGALIERESTNLLTTSTGGAIITGPGNSNASAAASPDFAPDGTLSMQRTTSTATSGYVRTASYSVPADNTNRVVSAIVPKTAASNIMALEVVLVGGTGSISYVRMDQRTGLVSLASAPAGYGVVDQGGFWLVWLAVAIGNNNVLQIAHYPVYGGIGSGDIGWINYEIGTYPTSRIKTAGAAVTRQRDALHLPFGPALSPAAGTLTVRSIPPGGAVDRVVAQIDDGTENNRVTIRRSAAGNIEAIWVVAGVTLATMSLGAHTALAETEVSIGWSAGAIKAIRDGASLTEVAASLPAGLTTLRLGGNSQVASLDGIITRLSAWPTYEATAFQEDPSPSLATWGDSMAAGSGVGTPAEWWITLLGTALGRSIYNGGVGGETSSQVLARELADTTHRAYTTIIFCGHNSPNTDVDVANISAMIDHLSPAPRKRKVIVVSPLQNTGNAVGSTGYNTTLATRTALKALCAQKGCVYADLFGYLASLQPSDPNVANGYTPSVYLADTIHLDTAGQAAEAAYYASIVRSIGG